MGNDMSIKYMYISAVCSEWVLCLFVCLFTESGEAQLTNRQVCVVMLLCKQAKCEQLQYIIISGMFVCLYHKEKLVRGKGN